MFARTNTISALVRSDKLRLDSVHVSEGYGSQVQHMEVDAQHAGQRIDNFLITHLKGVPRSHIYRLLRRGEVRVNSGRVKAAYRLQAGDRLRIAPVRREVREAAVGPAGLGWLEARILFEDESLLVLDKPAGMAVHGGSGQSYGLIEALRALRPRADLELVHRLDRETSGCLLVSKRRSLLRALHEMLREGRVQKRYVALVEGPWRGGSRTVEAALQKNVLRSGERVVRTSPEGKTARSVFYPVRRVRRATLMHVALLTGRTHQIRVHASHIGHPVAGDDKYGSAPFNAALKAHGLKRLFLHADRVAFRRPDVGESVEFCTPLPEDLGRVLVALDPDAGNPE
jgi:23S rRNA pseudouridine955/2504/2580 synthase